MKDKFKKLVKYFLYLCIPLALYFNLTHYDHTIIFIFCAFAIIPLAGIMGEATEVIASFLGSGVGGLLNATFGNAAELIISYFALKKGLVNVVKATITGSIIGNILLVLGFSIFLGGLKHKVQRFNLTAAGIGSSMLVLSCIGLIIPATFHNVTNTPLHVEKKLSLAIAIILFAIYIMGLIFQLGTHKHLYSNSDDEPELENNWSLKKSILLLLGSTVLVAILSEALVGSLEHTAQSFHLNEMFMGVILLAIIGNAAEHATAVLMATRNKMDLVMTIAIGSSIQVALFVAPVLIFISHILGNPMSLRFSTFEILAIVIAVSIVVLVAIDGESNWLEGVQLIAVYLILAMAFYFFPLNSHNNVNKLTISPTSPKINTPIIFELDNSLTNHSKIRNIQWDFNNDEKYDLISKNMMETSQYHTTGTKEINIKIEFDTLESLTIKKKFFVH